MREQAHIASALVHEVREFAAKLRRFLAIGRCKHSDLPMAQRLLPDRRKTNPKGAIFIMDKMLVVVFDNENSAYEANHALTQLDNEGSISVYADAVIAKDLSGFTTVKQSDDVGPLGTLAGTSLGSLIGLIGGPVGMAVGASVGLLGGMIADVDNARIGDDFVDDVSTQLTPGKYALVAEINEEWTTPVDVRMEALGGTVFRRALSNVEQTENQEEVDAMKADLAQLKAEHAKAHADRKAKLQAKIDQLDAKIKARLDKAKERRAASEAAAKAKAEVLRTKAASLQRKADEVHV
jgi:uncharacterized membrane protein